MGNYSSEYTGAQVDEAVGYYLDIITYVSDANEVDQGSSGDGGSIKDLIDSIGTSATATIFLANNSGSGTTSYVLSTSIDLTSYPNLYLKFEPGAIIVPDVGVTLKAYSPEHIIASPRQQIIDSTNNSTNPLIFSTGGRPHTNWFGDFTSLAVNLAVKSLEGVGGDVILSGDTYTNTTAIALLENVNLIGTHTPGQDSPSTIIQSDGTTFNRTADVAVITMTGTNRTADRVGNNLIRGVLFLTDKDVSSEAVIDAVYADTVLIEKCTFKEDDTSTTVGHVIDVEECWDWHFTDCIWKHYGNSGGTKHVVRLYNGDDDQTNYFIFDNCKFYNGTGKTIYSDTTGGGDTFNGQIYFNNCKFEDASNSALVFISGRINNLHVRDSFFSEGAGGFISNEMRHAVITGNEMGGGTGTMISITAANSNWVISDNYFTASDAGPTEAINVDGGQEIKIVNNHFVSPGANYSSFIHLDGTAAGNELRGVVVSGNTVWETVYNTTPLVRYTGYAHPTMIVKDNPGYQDETVTTGSPTLFRHPGFTKLDSSGGAITATQPDGLRAGDIRTIVMTEASTSSTVSISHHETSDPEVATFDAVDETLVLMWTGTEWITIKATCTFL